jgi:hypothetical protein
MASDDNTTQTEDDFVPASGPDEFTMLKERAKLLNLRVSGNIGLDALRKKVSDHMNGVMDDPTLNAEDEGEADIPKKESVQQTRKRLRLHAMKLIRCRIYNLNPSKRDLKGELLTVHNRFVGTVRKFIPFGEDSDGGYHLEQILYDALKTKRFQQVSTKKDHSIGSVRMVPEYNIEILPALTTAELKELADKQGAAERMGG